MNRIVLAIDPGREKCGLALVAEDTRGVLFRAIVPRAELTLTLLFLLRQYPHAELIVGGGTTASGLLAEIQTQLPQYALRVAEESHTTLKARARYFRDYRPRWWERLLPAGLRLPPRPIDDYAAVVIAEEYLARTRSAGANGNGDKDARRSSCSSA